MTKFMGKFLTLLKKKAPEPPKTLVPWKEQVIVAKDRFNAIARENGDLVSYKQEAIFAMQSLSRNKTLQDCDLASIRYSVLNIATIGLSLNPALQLAYLVPRKDDGVMKCYLDISYRGLTKLATDTGACEWIKSVLVHKDDNFEWKGMHTPSIHDGFDIFNEKRTQDLILGKNIQGVYTEAKLSNGDILCETLSMAQINRTRESSPCKNGPWKTHPDEQMVKTGIRHIAKYVPKSNRTSDRLDQAIHILNEYDGEGKIINEDEPVLLINESQHSELHAILTNLSISNPDRQLNNLARSFRVQNIKQLPNDKFREAKNRLLNGISKVKHEHPDSP